MLNESVVILENHVTCTAKHAYRTSFSPKGNHLLPIHLYISVRIATRIMRLLIEADLFMLLHSAVRRTRRETSSHLVFLLEMFGSTLMYFRCEVHYEAVSREWEREREDRRARQATLLLCDRHPRPSRSTIPQPQHTDFFKVILL